MSGDWIARRIRVRGIVQGVGFRPFVHRLALRLGVHGVIRNESGQVTIEVEGVPGDVDGFLHALTAEAPPLARIDRIDWSPMPPPGRSEFTIASSAIVQDQRLPISPDVAVCDRCREELFDPGNRRFGYPFITCTDCGPRFTVIESMPYDRERTSMRVFTQCPECRAEYDAPGDRRHHSQTNSCARCGPDLWYEGPDGEADAMSAAVRLLGRGGILALRGLGGFHLAVDALDDHAVQRLRERKHREAKPFAVMVSDLDGARRLGAVGPAEAELLTSVAAPIVLLSSNPRTPLAPSVAPRLDSVGVMLPYTPIHHLLLRAIDRPLVMTSGNASEEPIATTLDDARERLRDIADGFLFHDREIVARYDDSVVRVVDGATVLLRRARGYAPQPVPMPLSTPLPLLAVGPHLKNTFALAAGDAAYVSQHIGDLENLETLQHFRETLAAFQQLFAMTPEVVVHDAHPGYLSTRVAREMSDAHPIAVQHHHAHVVAVAAEHGVLEPVIGIAFDGTGYGDDGAIWGGEFLVADPRGYTRIGHLRYAPLPGGDTAARQPWRSALAFLSLDPDGAAIARTVLSNVPTGEWQLVIRQMEQGINTHRTSSVGRLFDAVAAVLGVRRWSQYEGQAAMELEAVATHGGPLPLPRRAVNGDRWELDPGPLVTALARRRLDGENLGTLSAVFHESLAEASADLADTIRDARGLEIVALGGGVFQNARLLRSLTARLRQRGFRVLLPRRLSPNDGAISYGQAVIGAARLAGVQPS